MSPFVRNRLALAFLSVTALFAPAAVYAGDHAKRLTVPPAQEIEILDPHVDPGGKPKVLTVATPNGLKIDIPQVVLVHHFYYTGDRKFQGPMLPGGPTIVVATHPYTNERCYIPVQMPPGAPYVSYRASHIEYNFGQQAIVVNFTCCGGTSVTVKHGHRRYIPPTPQPHDDGIFHTAANVVATSAQGVVDTGKVLARPFIATFQALPLTRTPDDRAAQKQNDAVEHAATQAQQLDVTIPTNR
jgi:hypothetical protein